MNGHSRRELGMNPTCVDGHHRREICVHPTSSEGQRSYIVAEDGSASQEPDEYMIWTPRSWSDNDSLPASSIAGKSTSDLSKPRDRQGSAQVPQELLDVIERQDAVIERLVTWCQTLEDQAITHRLKLVEHEKAKDDYSNFRTTLRSELSTLRATARRKAKEHSVEANELYERMQAKVDARVAAWCSRQEGVCNRANRTGSPRPASRAQSGESSLIAHGRYKAAVGPPSLSRVPSNTSKGVSLPQRMPGRSHSTIELGMTSLPKQSTVSPLKGSCLESRCFERSASPDATRLSKRSPTKSTASPGQKGLSHQLTHKSPVPVVPASPGPVQSSSLSSLRPEVQKVIRDAASPRNSLKATMSKTSLFETVSPKTERDAWSTPNRARQSIKKASDRSGRLVCQSPTSPNRVASKSPPRQSRAGVGDSVGTGFKFVARSVSPPALTLEERVGSPKRSPRKVGDAASASRSSPRRSPVRQGTVSVHVNQPQENLIRSNSSKSSFAPPPRVGGAGPAGLVMQSFSSPAARIAHVQTPTALPTPPPSPQKKNHAPSSFGGPIRGSVLERSSSGNVGLGLLPQLSKATLSFSPSGDLPSPGKTTRGTTYEQANCVFGKSSHSH